VEQITGQKKSAPFGVNGYEQITVETLYTTKLQTFEKFSKLFYSYSCLKLKIQFLIFTVKSLLRDLAARNLTHR